MNRVATFHVTLLTWLAFCACNLKINFRISPLPLIILFLCMYNGKQKREKKKRKDQLLNNSLQSKPIK